MKQNFDIYCEGYRWFDNYYKTKKYFNNIKNTDEIQYYGQNVLVFQNLTELNIAIQELTLLRDSINSHVSKHEKIQQEFGYDNIRKDKLPYTGELFFEETKKSRT